MIDLSHLPRGIDSTQFSATCSGIRAGLARKGILASDAEVDRRARAMYSIARAIVQGMKNKRKASTGGRHMPGAVIYTRVSTDDQAKGISLEMQADTCREWCVRHGHTVEAIYAEPKSGRTTLREQFRALMQFCSERKKSVACVLFWRLDRVMRNSLEYALFRKAMSDMGIRLVSATQHFTDDPMGHFVEHMYAGMAQMESETNSIRTSACMRALQEKGYWTHGAPYGYVCARDADNRPVLAHHAERAPVIRELFEAIAAGTFTATDALAFAKARGLKISSSRFNELIHDPIYCGQIRTNLTRGQTFKACWQPIIDPVTFDRAQLVLSRGSRQRCYIGHDADFPLRGLLLCADCSKPLTGSFSRGRNGTRYAYYHCPHGHVRRSERQVDGDITTLVASVAIDCLDEFWIFVRCVEQTMQAETASATVQLGMDVKRRELLEAKADKLLEAFLAGAVPEDVYRRKSDELRINIADARMAIHEAERAEISHETMLSEAQKYLRDLPQLWALMEHEQRRELLSSLFRSGVTLSGQGVRTVATDSIFGGLRELCAVNSGVAPPTGRHSNRIALAIADVRKFVEVAA